MLHFQPNSRLSFKFWIITQSAAGSGLNVGHERDDLNKMDFLTHSKLLDFDEKRDNVKSHESLIRSPWQYYKKFIFLFKFWALWHTLVSFYILLLTVHCKYVQWKGSGKALFRCNFEKKYKDFLAVFYFTKTLLFLPM